MRRAGGERGGDAPRTAGMGRAGWIAAVAIAALLVYITVNTLGADGPGSRGPAPGDALPPFAAPLVDSDLEGDANVATRANQGDAGSRPACEVDDPRALNVCALAERGPVVLAFLTTGAEECVAQLDTIERVAARHPQVGFAAIAIRGDRDELRELVRERGWSFPVAHDRDGAVANLYGIAVCPAVVLARDGVVTRTALVDALARERALEHAVRRLADGAPGARADR